MLFLPRSFKLSSWSCRNSTWIETRCRALQKAGLVTGFSCVNIQFPGELGGLEWRRVGGRLTLSREDLWECKEQLKYLNSTPKIRNVECDLTLGITDLELIIKLQISKDLHKCVIHCSRSRAEVCRTLNIWKEFVGHLSWIRWWAAHGRNAKELVKKKVRINYECVVDCIFQKWPHGFLPICSSCMVIWHSSRGEMGSVSLSLTLGRFCDYSRSAAMFLTRLGRKRWYRFQTFSWDTPIGIQLPCCEETQRISWTGPVEVLHQRNAWTGPV